MLYKYIYIYIYIWCHGVINYPGKFLELSDTTAAAHVEEQTKAAAFASTPFSPTGLACAQLEVQLEPPVFNEKVGKGGQPKVSLKIMYLNRTQWFIQLRNTLW